MSEPQVTFLIPVWNGREFLCEAIRSVLDQTRDDWRLLVVDDASTDDSAAIATSYDDPRIELVRHEHNVGQTGALNTGLDLIETPWIARLDQDDMAAPNRFERQLGYLHSNPGTVMVGSWVEVIDERGVVVGHHRPPSAPEDVLEQLYLGASPVFHSAVTFSSSAARSVGGYPTDIVFAQDIGLWARLAAVGPIANVPEPLTYLRRHPAQTSRSHRGAAGLLRDALTVTAELPQPLAGDRKVRGTWRARRARLMIQLSLFSARAGDWPLARRSARDALSALIANPLAIFHIGALAARWVLRRARRAF